MRCSECDGNIDGHINLCTCLDEVVENLLGYVGLTKSGHVQYTCAGGPYGTIEQAKKHSGCEEIVELLLGKTVS